MTLTNGFAIRALLIAFSILVFVISIIVFAPVFLLTDKNYLTRLSK
jgi:hypothetical protein